MISNIIILISGKIRSGKNHLTKILTERLIISEEVPIYVKHLAFSNTLKNMCCLGSYSSGNITIDDAYNQYHNIKSNPEKIELQEICQKMKVLDNDIWVKMIISEIINDIMYDTNVPSVYIISDFRYPNEAEFMIEMKNNDELNANIFTVHINSDKQIYNNEDTCETIKEHSSENSLEDYKFFFEFDNHEGMFEESFEMLTEKLFFNWVLFYKYCDISDNEHDNYDEYEDMELFYDDSY